MPLPFTAKARKLGIVSGWGAGLGIAVYAAVLTVGLLTLPSPDQPIGGVLFTLLELLILLLMPVLVALTVAIHAWAPADTRINSLLSLVFMSLLAGVTCSVHFVILTVSRHPAFTESGGLPLLLSFKWPSIAYALDILGWDVFFPLAVLCAAPVFRGGGLAQTIRVLLIASGVLALAGLSGVVTGEMQYRNIGILGYAGVFPVAAVLIGVLFRRTAPQAG